MERITKEQFIELLRSGHQEAITHEMLAGLEAELSTSDYIEYDTLVDSKVKNEALAWILQSILGFFGAGLIYLGLENKRLVSFILLIVGWITIYFIVGIFLLLAMYIWSFFLVASALEEDKLNIKIRALSYIYSK